MSTFFYSALHGSLLAGRGGDLLKWSIFHSAVELLPPVADEGVPVKLCLELQDIGRTVEVDESL
jgi:hypothetical protein